MTRRNRGTSVDVMNEEPWECKICSTIYKDPNAKLLECQRCKDHFCIKCLNKSKPEYDLLSKTDSMWFCVPCRKTVEEHIVTDLKIEARCKEIMANYEQRIQFLELAVDTKCDETRVREIVEESIIKNSCDKEMIREIAKDEATKTGDAVHKKMEEAENKGTGPQKKATVTTVIEEMNERKAREKNLIIFGITENQSEVKQERIDHDTEKINELFYDAKINLEEGNIMKTKRLGKYDSKKDSRPLLVNLKSIDSKLTLFKNMHYIRGMPKYEKVNVSNDLTQSEREQEKVLWAEAKKLQEQCISGEYQYKVRGPPWARKVIRIKK
ncbi:Hypothetical predicted protein [Mytilus galloprovincialis]|uniref:Uncharacterized protein n=1 Tax=Mytilus galloprovincialis TaxID=29158 RepID=A0A8B6C5B5_MYTGA|nr:Hypothetical predicted protein [Mytilus galloprovincialis]